MRHTAFMIECGLEEDPPDGPDVPPVPWGDMLLKLQIEENQREDNADSSNCLTELKGSEHDCGSESSNNRSVTRRGQRELPTRSLSTDAIDTLALELTSAKQRRLQQQRKGRTQPSIPRRCNSSCTAPSRSLIAVKEELSPTVTGRRPAKTLKKHPPSKAHSNDAIENMGLSLAFAKTERSPIRRTPENSRRGKITKETFREIGRAHV